MIYSKMVHQVQEAESEILHSKQSALVDMSPRRRDRWPKIKNCADNDSLFRRKPLVALPYDNYCDERDRFAWY